MCVRLYFGFTSALSAFCAPRRFSSIAAASAASALAVAYRA